MSNFRHILKSNRWLLLIVLLSVLLKVILLLQGEIVNPDAATYLAAAEKHSQGLFREGLYYYKMPLYPLLLAVTHFFIPDWIISGQLLTVLALVAAIFPLYALTLRLFDRDTALWTVLLFAVLPKFNTVKIMRDPLFLLFTLGALYFLVVFFHEKRLRLFAGFCLMAILAIFMRIEGILLFAVAAGSVFAPGWNLKRLVSTKTFSIICLALLLMVVILLRVDFAGLVTMLRLNEVVQWEKGLYSLDLFSGYRHMMEAIRQLQLALPGGHLRNNLLEVTRHYAPLIYCIGLFEVLVVSVFPTSLLAFWAFRWRKKEKEKTFRWVILLSWVAFTIINVFFLLKANFIQTRYFWIPIVLTLPWIGYGISLWWQEGANKKIIAPLVVLLIFIAPLSRTITAAMESDDMIIVDAGCWLRDNDPLKKIALFYNDRRLPLYSQRLSDVKRVRKLAYLRKFAKKNKNVAMVALYLSKRKNENYNIQGFEPVKIFEGNKKIVVVLGRQ